MWGPFRGMSLDPGSVFGSLLQRCLSDRYSRNRGDAMEGVAFVLLGLASSLVTTYVLSLAGILV